MDVTTHFLNTKLKLNREILDRFDFSSGLLNIVQRTKITNGHAYSRSDAIQYHSSLIKMNLDSFGQMSIFPITFDHLDTVIDLELSTTDKKFKEKIKTLKKDNRARDEVLRYIELKTYSYSTILRNKLIHHVAKFSDDGTMLLCEDAETPITLEVEKFGLLNKLIYTLATNRSSTPNLLQKTLLHSAYSDVFGNIDRQYLTNLPEAERIPKLNFRFGHYLEDRSEDSISPDTSLFEQLAVPPSSCGYDSEDDFLKAHPDPDEKILQGNWLYILTYEGRKLIVPSKAIISNKGGTLAAFSDWAQC